MKLSWWALVVYGCGMMGPGCKLLLVLVGDALPPFACSRNMLPGLMVGLLYQIRLNPDR